MSNYFVYGVYDNRERVVRAIDALRKDAYRSQDITVLFPESAGTAQFAREHDTNAPGAQDSDLTAGEPLGWLAGVGALVPGIGPFVAAMSWGMLVGGGATREYDSPRGALVGMGVSEAEIHAYEDRIHNGGILVAIHCDDENWATRAKEDLEKSGAEEIGVSEAHAKTLKA